MLGAFAGLVLTAQVASASPMNGDGFLLPAFAAVFLGATQFRLKRFSAWGAVLAVFMLGTGQYGLLLAGAPQWTPNVFQGLALIAAIGLSRALVSKNVGVDKKRFWGGISFGRTVQSRPSPDVEPATSVARS
jgi:ribose/xylose/arabinose/galactoside ABC-type transport system permease subunit